MSPLIDDVCIYHNAWSRYTLGCIKNISGGGVFVVLQALIANGVADAIKCSLMKYLPSDASSVSASVMRDILCRWYLIHEALHASDILPVHVYACGIWPRVLRPE